MYDETIMADAGEVLRLLGYFKQHIRITSDDADGDLQAKLQSALTSVGHDVHRVLVASTVTATAVTSSEAGVIRLTLRGPVREIVSVSVNGAVIAEGEGYDIRGNRLTVKGDFSDAVVEVTYKAGYRAIPPDMWEAVCLRGAGSYANPLDTVQERQRASDVLLRSYRFKDWIS